MITWDDVLVVAPELSTVAEPQQAGILGMVARQVPVETWGDLQPDGARYLAAHIATIAKRKGLGPVTAEAVGQVSRAYASLVGNFGELGTTGYGVEYLRLIKLLPSALGEVF